MKVIPKPQVLKREDKFYMISEPAISIELGSFDQSCVRTFLTRVQQKTDTAASSKYDIMLKKVDGYAAEEYDLVVSEDGVCIKASTDIAIVHALTTLYQLMEGTFAVPFVHIHDVPRYAHRGLSLDCTRHFFDVREVKRIIEQMARVKMNVLHWHLTDDQGWRIESKRFPKLHETVGNEYFSQDEIREVVAFARERGIAVEPEIELPGHVSALLSAYPQYSCSEKPVELATYGGIHPIILCAGKESTYALISDLLDEICPLFPYERFHIGCDEAPKTEWENCPACQQKIKQEGLADEVELQGYFTNRVIEMLRSKGKTAICWNEALDSDNLDEQALIQFWTVNGADKLAGFVKKGGRFIYSDMFTYYFDYPYSMIPMRRLYEEALCIGDTDYSQNHALIGIEACMWTEHVCDTGKLEEMLFPRLYAAAEVMWCGPRSDTYESFIERLLTFLRLYHPKDMSLVPENGWNPSGDQRRNEAFAHMAKINEAMPPEHMAETAKRSAPSELFTKKFIECFFDVSDLPMLMKSMGNGE